ncbi:hypothetical protein KKA27_03450 [Patescibacteria group bacterium]|nr:hypothetical protein [Patescibacteria group bacterium]
MKDENPMKNCPRFSFCSAPICPLDPDWKNRTYLPGEPICGLSKSRRTLLGKDLPNKGLFKRELAGLKNWEKRTDKSKLEAVKILNSKGSLVSITPAFGD